MKITSDNIGSFLKNTKKIIELTKDCLNEDDEEETEFKLKVSKKKL